MAKGTIGKQAVVNKIKSAFGKDYIGEFDKKYYVWAIENGERIQIAISLTCPKVPVELAANVSMGDFNFEDENFNTVVAAAPYQPAEITDEERARVEDLMKSLGL